MESWGESKKPRWVSTVCSSDWWRVISGVIPKDTDLVTDEGSFELLSHSELSWPRRAKLIDAVVPYA